MGIGSNKKDTSSKQARALCLGTMDGLENTPKILVSLSWYEEAQIAIDNSFLGSCTFYTPQYSLPAHKKCS